MIVSTGPRVDSSFSPSPCNDVKIVAMTSGFWSLAK